MVRRAERPLPPAANIEALLADRGNRGSLHRFLIIEIGQDARQPAGQHGLAGARRADEQQVVRAGRGNGQRPLGGSLAADIGQIRRQRATAEGLVFGFGQALLAVQVGTNLQQMLGGQHFATGEQGFLTVAGRQHQLAPGLPAGDRDRQRAGDGPQLAGQCQLADELVLSQFVRGDLAGRRQNAERDRQIKATAVFRQISRGEVDGDALGGEVELGRQQGRADPILALFDRRFRQADDAETGQAGRQMGLNDHLRGLHAKTGTGEYQRQAHAFPCLIVAVNATAVIPTAVITAETPTVEEPLPPDYGGSRKALSAIGAGLESGFESGLESGPGLGGQGLSLAVFKALSSASSASSFSRVRASTLTWASNSSRVTRLSLPSWAVSSARKFCSASACRLFSCGGKLSPRRRARSAMVWASIMSAIGLRKLERQCTKTRQVRDMKRYRAVSWLRSLGFSMGLCALGLLSAQAGAGEMYRWVDKDGKVHFSDKPPPADARQTQQLSTPAAEPTSEASSEGGEESASARAARLRQAAEGIEADRLARQQNKAETAANKAQKARACTAARDELKRFETANVKFMVDENNQRHEMTDSQFAQVEKQLRDKVENACR